MDKKETKTERFQMRLTLREFALIERLSFRYETTMTEAVLKAVEEALAKFDKEADSNGAAEAKH